MKTIGLLGGMSWESTTLYYRWINEGIAYECGGLHSAKIVMVSVNFQEIEECQRNSNWDGAGRMLADSARRVEKAGADFLVICTNTMHKLVPDIERVIDIPILHIVDAAARRISARGIKTIGLLGTLFTMEETFYRDRLSIDHGIKAIIPPPEDRLMVHRIIYEELCHGIVKDASRNEFVRIMSDLAADGAEGIIGGCTEIVTLVNHGDTTIPLFDTTAIHAEEAVAWALSP